MEPQKLKRFTLQAPDDNPMGSIYADRFKIVDDMTTFYLGNIIVATLFDIRVVEPQNA